MRTDLDLTQLGACSDGLYNICLNNGRFNVTIDWTTPFGNSGPAKMHRISPDAAYGTFFNDNNAEVFIKVLDACSFNPYNDFWVFSTHLSNVEYTITVTDTQTNQVRTTFNPQGYIAPAILATNTIFTECGSGDGSGLPPSEFLDTRSLPPNANPIVEEYIDPSVIGACIPDQNTMCLNNGRFRVHATFENFQGGGGDAKQWQLTNESGYSTFFNDSNVELFFKVHPACVDPWNNSWVFAGGLTNVPVEFYVEDTAFGKVYHVTNPSGRPFSTVLDTDTIFTDCPVNSTGNASSPLMSGLEQIAAPATGGTALTNHRVALHEVYNRLDVDTPAGTARSGHVVSHVGLDQKVGGAVLVSARNEENVADATPYFNGDVREMILLREIPTTGSQTAYALLTDPYVSQGVVNASTDVVTTTLGNATVSNSAGAAPKYAIGSTGDGVFGPALRGFSYSGISVTPEEASKMSLVPHVINTLYCNVANDCENQSGAIVSPMANAAVTRVEGLFGGPNQYMKWEQTDTNGMQGNANIHSTEWHAEPGNLIGMSYLPVREGPRLYGIGTSLNGDSGVIQPPPDGNTVTSYPSMEVPLDWRTPIQPFD
jgi:hypothetical protein